MIGKEIFMYVHACVYIILNVIIILIIHCIYFYYSVLFWGMKKGKGKTYTSKTAVCITFPLSTQT